MIRQRFALVVIILAVAAGSRAGLTQAGREAGRAVYGAGNNTCIQWTDARDRDTWMNAGQWVLGFVSASALYSKAAPVKTDARSIASWMDEYCLAHTGSDVSDAARELVELLISGKQP